MTYVYCDSVAKKVHNVTAQALSPVPEGWVEVQVEDGHDVTAHRPYWKLNDAGTGIEEDLLAIKEVRIRELAAAVSAFIGARYNHDVKLTLLMLGTEGNYLGYTADRMPYLQAMFDWANDVLALYEAKKGEILVLVTRAAVEAYDWEADLEAKDATDPKVDVATARSKVT